MPEYPRVREILGAIFSIDTGLSDASQSAMFRRSLQNPEWRAAFSKELLAAASDPHTSWIDMLSNEQYEVIDICSEKEARDFAMSLLWRSTFPDKPVPQI